MASVDGPRICQSVSGRRGGTLPSLLLNALSESKGLAEPLVGGWHFSRKPPISPTSAADWNKVIRVTSVAALATMAFGAIVLPLVTVIAGMTFAG
jgi:hypothetical protein